MQIYLLAFILGLVQGVAEFLPISSSGHLSLANELLASLFDDLTVLQGSEFSIAVHVGTLGSIVIVYWRRLLAAATNVRLIALVVLATLPVVVSGLLLKDRFEAYMENPTAVGCALLVTAVLLAAINPLERWHASRRVANALPGAVDAPASDAIAAPGSGDASVSGRTAQIDASAKNATCEAAKK